MSIQVWVDQGPGRNQVIALSRESLYVEDLKGPEAEAKVSKLATGEAPDGIFGVDATHIPLRRLTKIAIDRNDDSDIDLYYYEGKEKENETLSVSAKDTRDNIYNALRDATSSRFLEFVEQYSRARSAFASLATLTVFGLMTWGLSAAAIAIRATEEIEITGRKQGLKQLFVWALDLLGPWGVGIIGGLLCLLAVATLISRVKTPQLMYILQSEPHKQSSTFGTIAKYALLLAVWAWVAAIVLL